MFQGYDASGQAELWTTGGTAAGTTLLRDVLPGTGSSSPGSITAIGGGRAVFVVAGLGNIEREPYITDGTAAGTVLLRDINPALGGNVFSNGSSAGSFAALGNGRVLFTAYTAATGFEAWVTDGTPAGTQLLLDIAPGSMSGADGAAFTPLGNGQGLFKASTATTGPELWVTNGTAAGTTLVRDLNPGTAAGLDGYFPMRLGVVLNNRLLFRGVTPATGAELYAMDGTAAGTTLVSDIVRGAAGSGIGDFALANLSNVLGPRGRTVAGTVTDGTGDALYTGSTSADTVEMAEGRRGTVVTPLASGDVTLAHAGQTDTPRRIGTPRFIDGWVVFDASDPAAAATRFYQAPLGRAPDQGSLKFWTSRVQCRFIFKSFSSFLVRSAPYVTR